MKEKSISTRDRTQFLEVTGEIQEEITAEGIRNGIVTVFVPHTTAGVTINEHADPDVMRDMKDVFDSLIPWQGDYRHMEGNTAAHVKTSLMGSSVQVIVANGRLQLGTWQGIFFCEFDGPRSRKYWVHVDSSD